MKERYRQNSEWAYNEFNIPLKQRGSVYNIHHRRFKSEGGSDSKLNLVPLKKEIHTYIHKEAEKTSVKLKDCRNCSGVICRDIDIAHLLKTDYNLKKITIEETTVDECRIN